MIQTIKGRVKEAKFYSIICDEAPDALNKEQFLFCLEYVNDHKDVWEDFLKFIHCKFGLTEKYLYNKVTEALSSSVLIYATAVVRVILQVTG